MANFKVEGYWPMQINNAIKVSFRTAWSTEKENTIISKDNFISEIGLKTRNMEKDYIFMKTETGTTESSKTIWNMGKEGLKRRMEATT